jgi:hypothetical protein
MGDLAQAETYLQRNLSLIQEARTSGLPGWRTAYAVRGQSWEADVELHRAIIFETRGQFADAETAIDPKRTLDSGPTRQFRGVKNPRRWSGIGLTPRGPSLGAQQAANINGPPKSAAPSSSAANLEICIAGSQQINSPHCNNVP